LAITIPTILKDVIESTKTVAMMAMRIIAVVITRTKGLVLVAQVRTTAVSNVGETTAAEMTMKMIESAVQTDATTTMISTVPPAIVVSKNYALAQTTARSRAKNGNQDMVIKKSPASARKDAVAVRKVGLQGTVAAGRERHHTAPAP
jgi:hypothetical protein